MVNLQNIKNINKKGDKRDWTIFIMLVLGILMAWRYQVETQVCRDTLTKIPMIACEYCDSIRDAAIKNQELFKFNGTHFKEILDNVIITEETNTQTSPSGK